MFALDALTCCSEWKPCIGRDSRKSVREVLSFPHGATLQPWLKAFPLCVLTPPLPPPFSFFVGFLTPLTKTFLPVACGTYSPGVATFHLSSLWAPPHNLLHSHTSSLSVPPPDRLMPLFVCIYVCVWVLLCVYACGQMNQDVCWKWSPMDSPGTIPNLNLILKHTASQHLHPELHLRSGCSLAPVMKNI